MLATTAGPGITMVNSFRTGITYYKMYGVITGFRVLPLCDSGPCYDYYSLWQTTINAYTQTKYNTFLQGNDTRRKHSMEASFINQIETTHCLQTQSSPTLILPPVKTACSRFSITKKE